MAKPRVRRAHHTWARAATWLETAEKWLASDGADDAPPFSLNPLPQIRTIADLAQAANLARARFRCTAKEIGRAQSQPWDKLQTAKYGEPTWFRGEPDRDPSWLLQPEVFRPDLYPKDSQAEHTPEKFMLLDFRAQAGMRHHNCPGLDALPLWMAFARHWGLPTRLLDWSTSIMVAAWFATNQENELRGENDQLLRDIVQLRPKG
ncbi:MAG: FRG domain-containing protein, partial [Planctomycetes bacterium]|nr:FRG domain-containing protein [Planctomycetota bacterium]